MEIRDLDLGELNRARQRAKQASDKPYQKHPRGIGGIPFHDDPDPEETTEANPFSEEDKERIISFHTIDKADGRIIMRGTPTPSSDDPRVWESVEVWDVREITQDGKKTTITTPHFAIRRDLLKASIRYAGKKMTLLRNAKQFGSDEYRALQDAIQEMEHTERHALATFFPPPPPAENIP
jgi:hypothetical protein